MGAWGSISVLSNSKLNKFGEEVIGTAWLATRNDRWVGNYVCYTFSVIDDEEATTGSQLTFNLYSFKSFFSLKFFHEFLSLLFLIFFF